MQTQAMVKAHSGRIYLQKKESRRERMSLSESKGCDCTLDVGEFRGVAAVRGGFWDMESQGYKVKT